MSWYRLHRFVSGVAARFCRHPKDTICAHRQYEYDQWLRGYLAGIDAGRGNVEAKWLGSISGEGPYANYPAPTPRPEPVR